MGILHASNAGTTPASGGLAPGKKHRMSAEGRRRIRRTSLTGGPALLLPQRLQGIDFGGATGREPRRRERHRQ